MIAVASQNPVKLEATRIGFQQMFPETTHTLRAFAVPSGVREQPMSHDETLQGAINRAQGAFALADTADYAIGIEGGIKPVGEQLAVFAWVVITDGQRLSQAQTGIFYLPQEVAHLVRDGYELGHADDIVFGRNNSKQSTGSIGLLTDDALTRTTYYVQAVIMALIPFKKPQFTWV
ncbi:MAG: inosine/xanthosine triphosphatase [Chloroflexota bacterium]